MSEGGGLLLPLEVQPADKTLLPFLHHNLVVNSASENTFTAVLWLMGFNWPLKKLFLPQVLACFMEQKPLQPLWLS